MSDLATRPLLIGLHTLYEDAAACLERAEPGRFPDVVAQLRAIATGDAFVRSSAGKGQGAGRETVTAVIGKVTPQPHGWDIALAPDNETWVSVHREDGIQRPPQVGDIATIRVPRVVAISRVTRTDG